MNKKIFAITLAVILTLCVLPVGSLAASVSPAMEILAEDAKMIKSGIAGSDVKFSATDFKQALGIRKFSSLTISSLPDESEGVLKYANVRVSEGQTISAKNVYLLKFVPASNLIKESSFTFKCDDYVGGEDIVCELKLLEKINYEPTLNQNSETALTVSTRQNISLYGRASAYDPEGDELKYFIVSYPQNGSVVFTDAQHGCFKYTPNINYTGKDKFTYVVRDSYGNFSHVASVKISVAEKDSDIVYTDMHDNSAYNAALTLAQEKIMLGQISGDGMYFYPDSTVSRGEFLVMVMKAAGITPTYKESTFDDNESIPSSIRPYVATAQNYRYINGKLSKSGLTFDADSVITRAEAAVMVNNILNLSEPTMNTSFSDDEQIPAWAKGAVSALYSLGIMERTENGTMDAQSELTRGQAAQMVYAVLELCE
jgi:hypothetical protein